MTTDTELDPQRARIPALAGPFFVAGVLALAGIIAAVLPSPGPAGTAAMLQGTPVATALATIAPKVGPGTEPAAAAPMGVSGSFVWLSEMAATDRAIAARRIGAVEAASLLCVMPPRDGVSRHASDVVAARDLAASDYAAGWRGFAEHYRRDAEGACAAAIISGNVGK